MKKEQIEFLGKMQEILQTGFETKLSENVLAFLLTDIGLHKSKVKAELMFYDEDCEIPGKESGVLQIYITVCSYREEQTNEVGLRLLELNTFSLLGNFNLYKPLNHIFYRYSLPIPDLAYEGAPEIIMAALSKLSVNLNYLYNYLTLIGDNVNSITLQEYQDEMENLKSVLESNPDFLDNLKNRE